MAVKKEDVFSWCDKHQGDGYFSCKEREYLNQSNTEFSDKGAVKGKKSWLSRHFFDVDRSDETGAKEEEKDFLDRLSFKIEWLNKGGHYNRMRERENASFATPNKQEEADNTWVTLFVLCLIALSILLKQIWAS